MKRRSFLIVVTSIVATIAGGINTFAAEIKWVAEGGPVKYKEKSEIAGKKCELCKFFKDDKLTDDGGLCTSVAVNRNQKLYVKKSGYCTMFNKKA